MPKPEERLLAVVNALLHRCYKVPYANAAEVPALLRKELAGVCKACYTTQQQEQPSSATQRQTSSSGGRAGSAAPEGSGGGSDKKSLREAFVRDMNPDGPNFPTTLGALAEQLKVWRGRLQADLEDRLPLALRLSDEARPLVELSLAEVEMPGQYLAGHEVAPDGVVFLECFGAAVAVVRRHSTSFRWVGGRLWVNGNGAGGYATALYQLQVAGGCGCAVVCMCVDVSGGGAAQRRWWGRAPRATRGELGCGGPGTGG